MDAKLSPKLPMPAQDRSVAEVFARERQRLLGFIRGRVPEPADVEDILQDVFSEFVEAARLPTPIEQVGAWLFRVARNRIVDRFRRRRAEAAVVVPGQASEAGSGDDAGPAFEDLLPSPDAGPEAAYARRLLLDELEDALDELPAEQRDVFVAHELDGRSFKSLAEETGVSVNTLLSRKRYAVLHLRRRLQALREEFDR